MKNILTPILCIYMNCLFAQQTPQYSMSILDPYAINPAYAGMENTLVATGIYRQQWTGLKGGPISQHVDAHLPIFAINSGVGIRFDNDAIGAHTATAVMINYSYQVELNRTSVLSFGVGGGYLQYVLDGTKLRAPDGTYSEPNGTFTHNDDLLPEGKWQSAAPTFESGICLKTKKMLVGLSAQPIFVPTLKDNNGGRFGLQLKQSILLHAQYMAYSGDLLQLRPSILVKNDIIETQIDISILARWRENTFAAVSYRGYSSNSKDAAVLMGGFKLNERTTLAYAYDIPLSALNAANRGSHELLIQYNLNRPIGAGKLPPIIYNPRFF